MNSTVPSTVTPDLLRALCGDELRNVFLVADDDQEIFTFAGASSRHYTALAQEFEAEPMVLSTNFRCARRTSRGVLLTRPAKRTDRFGRVHRDAPSPFLSELGLAGS